MNTDEINNETMPNEIDQVTAMLRLGGEPTPEAWREVLEPDAYHLLDGDARRFLINRALRNILNRNPAGTHIVRSALPSRCDYEHWYEVVSKTVVPTIIDLKLLAIKENASENGAATVL